MQKRNYFPALDGMRLMASVNIVLLHLASSNALTYLAGYKWIYPIASAPAFAAGIFYVLAGFLFASKFSDPERQIPVLPFMYTRIKKLYRLHFAMTLLMFGVMLYKLSGYTHFPAFNELGDCFSKGLSAMAHPFRSLFLHLTLLWSLVPDLGMKLNEPSWSLTSFLFCYAVTPFFARYFYKQNRKKLWILFALVFVPDILWAFLFGCTGNLWFEGYNAKYRFFHIFPLIRIFEYLLGMILFRLYSEGAFDFFKKDYVSGIFQIAILAIIYACLFLMDPHLNPGMNYFLHHNLPLFFYAIFLISLLSGKGIIAKFFCLSPIRKIGKASFYPYLIHLPLISIAWGICNLNTPKNTLLFLIFVYGISTAYNEWKTWRRKKINC